MVEIKIHYDGNLQTTCTHGPSSVQLKTDAPKDNMGQGLSYSPTDLVATALASCMITTMGIGAKRHNFNMDGTEAVVQKIMTASPVRRIGELVVTITVPSTVPADQRGYMERLALSCPVHQSLHPDVKITTQFIWK